MRVVAIVPAYNEARRLGEVIRTLRPRVDEVVVVDDGSGDATASVAAAAGATVIRHPLNRGQGAALKTGVIFALRHQADVLLHFDADGQHDAASVPDLLAPILSGVADVVIGSRYLGLPPANMPWQRRWLLVGAKSFNRLVLGIPRKFTDPQSGLRAMTATAARSLKFRHDRMAHCSELLGLIAKSSWRWQEVPVRVRYTPETLAKGQGIFDAVKIVWQLIVGAISH